jgi:hypothetical protein
MFEVKRQWDVPGELSLSHSLLSALQPRVPKQAQVARRHLLTATPC